MENLRKICPGIVVVGGAIYYIYKLRKQSKIDQFNTDFVQSNKYSALKSQWNQNLSTIEQKSAEAKETERGQQELLKQIEPLQRRLAELAAREQALEAEKRSLKDRNASIKDELHDVKQTEKMWLDEHKKQIDATAKQRLAELNIQAYNAYREQCEANARRTKDEANRQVSSGTAIVGRADQVLGEIIGEDEEPNGSDI